MIWQLDTILQIIHSYIRSSHSVSFPQLSFFHCVTSQQTLSHGGSGFVLLCICPSPTGINDFWSGKPQNFDCHYLVGQFGLVFCP